MMNSDTLRSIIAKRAATDDECYEDVEQCWAELGTALTEDYDATGTFLLEDATEDEIKWSSEVFEEIFEKAPEQRYVDLLGKAIERLADQDDRLRTAKILDQVAQMYID